MGLRGFESVLGAVSALSKASQDTEVMIEMIEYIILILNGLGLGLLLAEVGLLGGCFYGLLKGESIWSVV